MTQYQFVSIVYYMEDVLIGVKMNKIVVQEDTIKNVVS